MSIQDLRQRRIAIKASLEDVAAEAGVRAGTVSRWERGLFDPHPVMMQSWVNAIEHLEAIHNATKDDGK